MRTISVTGRIAVVLLSRIVLASSVVLLALAAAGCGGGSDDSSSSSSGTDAKTWAKDVCGALDTWSNDVKSGSKDLGDALRDTSSPKDAKDKVVAYLEDVQDSTETMVDDVKAAGTPAIEKGQAIQDDLENGLEEARDSFDQAVESAKKIDTSNLRAFTTGLSNLSQQIQTQLTQASGDLKGLENKYDVGELNDALKNEPSCKSIVSSS
jgi:hypothetical protein